MTNDQMEKIRAAYDKVKVFPESRPDGFMDLLLLRNLVGEWLESQQHEPTLPQCEHGYVPLLCPHCGANHRPEDCRTQVSRTTSQEKNDGV